MLLVVSTACVLRETYLVCADKVNGNADIGDVNQPKGIIESKAGEEIARSIISKRCITNATT